jgi:methionine sulfoxide reductase heme-binding subunit
VRARRHHRLGRAGKNDFAEVAVYAAIIAMLLGWRARGWLRKSVR